MNVIDIISRYGDNRKFELISDYTVVLSGLTHFNRYGSLEDGSIGFIDFDGGPFISVDEILKFKNASYKIIKIVIPDIGDRLYFNAKLKGPILTEIHLKVKKIENE